VVLIGLFALGSGKPLMLGAWGWFALVPVAVCGVAWLRIYRSEETLAGRPLARWGLLLAGFVGLGYGAYSFAVNLALRQQAEQFARDWLDLIRQGRLEQAMFRSLPPLQRADLNEDDKDLLGKIASRAHDAAEEIPPAALLQRFAQTDLVRYLARGGSQSTATFQGFQWDYTHGGYDVRLNVHIDTPECSIEAVMTVHGTQAPHGEFAGRQWRVVYDRVGLDQQAGGIRLKPLGETVKSLSQAAGQFLSVWQQQLATPTKEEAFLLTLPEDERKRSRRALHRALASAALAGGAIAADSAILTGYRRFLAGDLVAAPPPGFTTNDDLEKKTVAAVRNLFAEGSNRPTLLPETSSPEERSRFWTWTRKGDKVEVAFTLRFRDMQGNQVSAAFLLEGDARALEEAPPHWRFAGVKLLSAMKPPSRGRGPRPQPASRR
jgi:hypothetical protein